MYSIKTFAKICELLSFRKSTPKVLCSLKYPSTTPAVFLMTIFLFEWPQLQTPEFWPHLLLTLITFTFHRLSVTNRIFYPVDDTISQNNSDFLSAVKHAIYGVASLNTSYPMENNTRFPSSSVHWWPCSQHSNFLSTFWFSLITFIRQPKYPCFFINGWTAVSQIVLSREMLLESTCSFPKVKSRSLSRHLGKKLIHSLWAILQFESFWARVFFTIFYQ